MRRSNRNRRGYLVRVGIDSKYGKWNAPMDPITNEFMYVPIPENEKFSIRKGMRIEFNTFSKDLNKFRRKLKDVSHVYFELPEDLKFSHAHLDPDFRYLTYGDNGQRRGADVSTLEKGDFVVFYSALKPVKRSIHKLVYALIGILVVENIEKAVECVKENYYKNAHTRKDKIGEADIIVTGQKDVSGRFEKCIPIGEWRDRAYRVRKDLLDEWGGLSVTNGFIQLSAVPPEFLDADKFSKWLNKKKINLLNKNN
jgi:hypothetical protein